MATRKLCIFCGRSDRKISSEHAWPNWIRVLFAPGPSTITSGPVNGAPRKWIARDDMGVKVNAICKPCNEGWMNDLEVAVRPLLSAPIRHGTAVSLSAEQQGVVAGWAYKTAMVFEFAGHTPVPFYTADDRRALMESGRAPRRNVFINLAAYTGGVLCTAHHHMVGYDLMEQPGDAVMANVVARCTTITAGRFAVQVFGIRLPDEVHQLEMPIRGEGWQRRVVGIWPNPYPAINWPPPEILDDPGLVRFANRWNVGPQP